MKISLGLPQLVDAMELKHFAQRAEDLGFDYLFIGDHIALPSEGTTQYPYTPSGALSRPSTYPFLEAMTALSFLAACTTCIKLGTSVAIMPYRHPVLAAKMLASLDVLSNGRAVCGVGVGWLAAEYETLGVQFHERGRISDEFLEVVKLLWTDAKRSYRGQFFHFDRIEFSLKPIQKPHIPIWIGGHSDQALRRVAVYGDCWHPARRTPDSVSTCLPRLWEEVARAGRDRSAISIALKRSVHFTDLSLSERHWVRSSEPWRPARRKSSTMSHIAERSGLTGWFSISGWKVYGLA